MWIFAGARRLGVGGFRLSGHHRAIVADIFANNCVKNGVLTVVLTKMKPARSLAKQGNFPTTKSRSIWSNANYTTPWILRNIPDRRIHRHCLLEGLDEIALTLQHEADICAYEGPAFPAKVVTEICIGEYRTGVDAPQLHWYNTEIQTTK